MKSAVIIFLAFVQWVSALKLFLLQTASHQEIPKNPSSFAPHRRRMQELRPRSTCHNMFSGIIEEMGTVDGINLTSQMKLWDGSIGEGFELTIKSSVAVEEAYIGCSIAVNGVCLTATSYDTQKFTVGLAPETLRRSNLGLLKPGSRVNLERALKADGRNSGHFVQGHVDCTGEILEKWREGESLWVRVKVPQDITPYIVPKGFICVDGTSLTICNVDSRPAASWFTFMLVAHTQQSVIIPSKAVGELVNIEVDVLAKMVERSLSGMNGSRTDNSSSIVDEIENLKSRVKALEDLVQTLAIK